MRQNMKLFNNRVIIKTQDRTNIIIIMLFAKSISTFFELYLLSISSLPCVFVDISDIL